jgi:hypothetical protein
MALEMLTCSTVPSWHHILMMKEAALHAFCNLNTRVKVQEIITKLIQGKVNTDVAEFFMGPVIANINCKYLTVEVLLYNRGFSTFQALLNEMLDFKG